MTRARWRLVVLVGGLGTALAACDPGNDWVCRPNNQTICSCIGAPDGIMTCLPDGSGWGECQCCEPSCAGKDCGADGCGGSCGTCTPPETCSASGVCACVPSCAGRVCGPDPVCGTSCGTCQAGTCNAAGQCDCTPDCAGRECGPDPVCAANCGTCTAPEACNAAGQCECVPDCAGRECGADPACGTSCGTCQGAETCDAAGQCQCTPTCTNRECGGDGCGGSCGTCNAAAGEVCAEATGQCLVCTPSCAGRECGLDPVCGASCGTCAATESCDATGQCQCVPSCGNAECGLAAGGLVITEIMADPEGADDGKEWFEIYNASGVAIDLTGLVVAASAADGTGEATLTLGAARVEAGEYFVLGGMEAALRPAWVDYPYGAAIASLRNSNGRLALLCGAQLLDQVTYGTLTSGASMGFDGSLLPDATANDDQGHWCDATLEYEAGARGSPGAANEECEPVLPPGQCLDGDTVRAIRPPAASSLVITEFMPNPDAVGDDAGEWLEVYTLAAFDLNGLEIGKIPPTIEQTVARAACIPIPAGTYFVLARSADAATNGGLPRVDAVLTMTLSNTGAQGIFIGYGGAVLDAITYTSSFTGAATTLDPDKRNPTDNDVAANWCQATAAYGAGDLGTPGTANPSCGIVTPGYCLDNGSERPKVAPAAGDLVIAEIMPNPAAVGDTDGEWFEVHVARTVDLNGLELGRTAGSVDLTLPEGDCLRVNAGAHLLFARQTNPALNGGLPTVDVQIGFALVNTDGALFVGFGGVVLDAVTWTTSGQGVASSLDPGLLDPTANDAPAAWCPAVTDYGTGAPPDKGTPRAANPDCP